MTSIMGFGILVLTGGLTFYVVMKVRRCQIRRRGLAERRQEEALELAVRHPHERQVSPAPQAGDADSSGASGRDGSPAREPEPCASASAAQEVAVCETAL